MKQSSYSSLKSQLDDLVVQLQNPDVDIDEAIKLHSEATKIIKQLEAYLKDTELKIKKATKQ